MILRVEDGLWARIYYPIRDHLMDGMPALPRTARADRAAWLEERFRGMGIRLYNDGSPDRRWTHVEIRDEDLMELVLRWA